MDKSRLVQLILLVGLISLIGESLFEYWLELDHFSTQKLEGLKPFEQEHQQHQLKQLLLQQNVRFENKDEDEIDDDDDENGASKTIATRQSWTRRRPLLPKKPIRPLVSDRYRGAPGTHVGMTAEEIIEKTSRQVFIFQTSGGMNNQRIIMERALEICRMFERVCLMPMVGRHSSFFSNYNKLKKNDLIRMDRVFDFQGLAEYAEVAPITTPFSKFLEFAKGKTSFENDWFIVDHDKDARKENPIKIANLTQMTSAAERVIYFGSATMWQKFGKNFEQNTYNHVRYSPFFRAVADDAITNLRLRRNYIAFHSRQGDHGEKWEQWVAKKQNSTTTKRKPKVKFQHQKGFSSQYLPADALEDPGKFMESQIKYILAANHLEESQMKTLYLATKPSANLDYYQNITAFNLVFSQDIPSFVTERLQEVFDMDKQKRLFNDLLGIVEQLICARAFVFVGFKGSTFSEYIERMRKEPLINLLVE